MFIKNYEELEKHVKARSRIIYRKSGSRTGWEGRLFKIRNYSNYEKVVVEYDNGKFQEYDPAAFIGNEYDSPYLELIGNNTPSPTKNTPSVNNYIIIDNNGKTLDFCGTQEEAVQFAAVQVVDATSYTKIHIYRKDLTIQPKPKELEVIQYQ